MRYALIGSGSSARPAPRRLAAAIEIVREEIGVQPSSLARNQAAVDFARKRGAVLSSQAELYDGYRRGLPGFNPANPPGRSTHELRNDGVAYSLWPAGAPIPWWALGQDWQSASSARRACQAYRRHGWIATVTYPGSSNELHHINLRRAPVIARPLQRGDRGRAVKKLQRQLRFLVRPDRKGVPPAMRGKRYLSGRADGEFDANVERALELFQRDHLLNPDGKRGKHTAAQLRRSVRERKVKLKRRRKR